MDFIRIKDLLLSRALPEGFKSRLKEAEAVARWDAAVGPIIAKYAQAVRVDEGVLFVVVSHPIWRSELHHRKRQILEILNQSPGKTQGEVQEVLKDLYFIDPKKPYRALNAQTNNANQNHPGTLDKNSGKPPAD